MLVGNIRNDLHPTCRTSRSTSHLIPTMTINDSNSFPSSPSTTTTTTNNNISIITRYIPARALYVRRNFKKFVNFSFYRQLFRMPLSFLYTFYVKLQPLLPWNIARIAFTFCKS